jgi:hypothetical protein
MVSPCDVKERMQEEERDASVDGEVLLPEGAGSCRPGKRSATGQV